MADIPLNGQPKVKAALFHIIKDIVLIVALLGAIVFFSDIKVGLETLKIKFTHMERVMKEIVDLHPRTQGGTP